jgi:DHA1 family tetracycline resistance protein-like MFS transporter
LKEHRAKIGIVFLIVFIDLVGFGIVIPILPLYAEEYGPSPVVFGLLMASFSIMQFLAAPILGRLSDRIGRRPVLLVSLFGSAVGYVLFGIAGSLAMLFASRIIDGISGGNISTAQAVIADITAPEDRAKGMGIIGAAFGAGMVIGPALGGVAANFDEKAPFYAVAILAAANFVLAWIRLPESRPRGLRLPGEMQLRQAFIPTPIRLMMMVHDRRIALFLYLFFHLFTAFAVLEALFPAYAGDRFGKNELDIGILFGWIGIVLFITQGVLLRRLVASQGEQRLILVGTLAMGLGLAMIAWAPSFGWCYVVGTLIAFGNGITFPAFMSLYSKACEAENAGELLGQSQAMATTGRIVGPVMGGAMMDYIDPRMPFLIAGAMMLGALLIFRLFRRLLLGTGASRELESAENPATPG